jgi:DNA-binding CsgD family transcriptional regulator
MLPGLGEVRSRVLSAAIREQTGCMESVRCPVVVGRDAEMKALRIALAEAEAARGGVVVLAGEAGVGKSRLLGELAEAVRIRGGLAVTGRAVASGAATPFRPLSEALLQALRVRELPGNGWGPWSAALQGVIPVQVGDAVRSADTVAEILPTVRGEAVVRLLRALAGPAGLLVGLEDLQWADPDSLAVVEYLADNLRAERVLCVVTVRPEPGSPGYDLARSLDMRRNVRFLSLGRLSAEQTGQMVLACRPAATREIVRYVVDAADGVPFLVEELLAAPGVPASFAAGVAARLAGLDEAERRVIQVAAVLGRQFDWRLLLATGAGGPRVVGQALEHAVGNGLLDFHGDAYQFRHALIREAILDSLLPHVRAELSQAALAAVEAGRAGLQGASRDLAADLAIQAGDTELAARLLTESGRDSLRRGALATAASTLRRACGLAGADPLCRTANALLAEALALAGRVDECMSASAAALRLSAAAAPAARAQIHLTVAHAAAEAARWPVAADHLASAERLLGEEPDPVLTQRWRVLAAETALAERDVVAARRLAELVLESAATVAEVRCHALGLLGRSHRARDLDAARVAFEKALACAEMANLPLWRLRALHELGTIELFEQAGTGRLAQALRTALDLGALSMAAVLDIQLAAAYLFRFDPDPGQRHAASALAVAERLQLTQVRATALVFLAELAGLRRDGEAMERHNSLALAAAPGDKEIEGSVWGGRGITALLEGDDAGARQALERAVECLAPLPNSGPGIYLGLWPLLLAVHADTNAGDAIASARRTGMTVNRANRGMLLYAEAVLAGRRPDRDLAAELADRGAAELAHFPVWSDLARMLTARAALADGWGEPRRWLISAARSFGDSGLEPLVQRCRAMLAEPAPGGLLSLGVTPREIEVLDLVAAGLPNKDIAARLYVSHRTVEKHIESLLRKTGARSRTQLATARAGALRPPDR